LALPDSWLSRLNAKVVQVDSEDGQHRHPAADAIDGDPNTFWHTRWGKASDAMPHFLVVDLGREMKLAGVSYLPRQDQPSGRIARCEVYCGNNPKSFGSPAAKATWTNTAERQALRFVQPITARYVKFVIRSAVNGQAYAAAAELDVIPAERPSRP
jgi:hypothetical protein